MAARYLATEMANDFLGDHPELRPYVLSDVQLTGTTIGQGAYGSVEEVAVATSTRSGQEGPRYFAGQSQNHLPIR